MSNHHVAPLLALVLMTLVLSSCHITAPRGNDGWSSPVMLALNVDDAPEVQVAAVN